MRDCNHTPAFTVFGGAYVCENHGTVGMTLERNTRKAGKIAVAAGILMLGISTATATLAIRGGDGLRPQASHYSVVTASFEDMVY